MRFGFSLAATGLIGLAVLAISFLLGVLVRRLRARRNDVQPMRPYFDKPSDVEQMKALMSGIRATHELVCSVLGKITLGPGDYHSVITVSFQTALEYVESNYSVDQIATTVEKSHDGYYAVPSGNTWHVYSQEKGGRFHCLLAQSETEVFRHFVEHVLRIKQ